MPQVSVQDDKCSPKNRSYRPCPLRGSLPGRRLSWCYALLLAQLQDKTYRPMLFYTVSYRSISSYSSQRLCCLTSSGPQLFLTHYIVLTLLAVSVNKLASYVDIWRLHCLPSAHQLLFTLLTANVISIV